MDLWLKKATITDGPKDLNMPPTSNTSPPNQCERNEPRLELVDNPINNTSNHTIDCEDTEIHRPEIQNIIKLQTKVPLPSTTPY